MKRNWQRQGAVWATHLLLPINPFQKFPEVRFSGWWKSKFLCHSLPERQVFLILHVITAKSSSQRHVSNFHTTMYVVPCYTCRGKSVLKSKSGIQLGKSKGGEDKMLSPRTWNFHVRRWIQADPKLVTYQSRADYFSIILISPCICPG